MLELPRPNKPDPPPKKPVFSLQDHLLKGYYVDAKDIDNIWRLARIMERDDKYVTIRFDAYESKYEEVRCRLSKQLYCSSHRLAPLRQHSEGYTGPSRRTSRDFLLKLQNMTQVKQRLDLLVAEEVPSLSAYEITQLLRGELFVLIDSLLTFPCQFNLTEVKAVAHFLEYYVGFVARFCEKCLALAPQHFQDFISNKEAYLTNPYAALLASLQQLLYSLMLIFLIKGEARNQLYNFSSALNVEEWDKSLLEHLKSCFLNKGSATFIKKIFNYKDASGKGFPCSIRGSCLLLLSRLSKSTMGIQLPTLELKDYNEVYKLIPLYLEFFPKEETEITVIEYSVQLAIGNSSFDSRLRGINELKSYIDRINSKESRLFRFITEEKLQEILKSSGFLEAIIDPRNFNSEIFKRSVPMLKILSQKKYLTNAHLSQIFKLAENRHESEIIAIYGVLAELATFASTDSLDHIFGQMIKLRLNQLTIGLLKDFTIKAIENLSKQSTFFGLIRRKKCSSKYDYYGVNVFWRQMQDDGALDPVLVPAAQEALKTIFAQESFKGLRDTYLGLCLDNIKKNKSLGQSLKLMLNILKSYSVETPMLIGEGRNDVVQRLDKKYEILKVASSSLRKSVFPKVPQQQCISYFFEFLEEYNSSLKQGLKVENLKSIWRVNDNQIELLNFLRKPLHIEDKEFKKKTLKRLPLQLIRELFTEVFLMGEFMNNYFEISPQVFDTVDELFLAMHTELKNLELNDKNTIRLLNHPLMGIQFYENLLLANKFGKATSIVLNKAKKRYVQLNLRLKDYTNLQKKVKLWSGMLERLLDLLPKNRNTMLPTIHEFLREVEGKMIRENVTQFSNIDIEVRYEGKDKFIRLPRNSSIFKLRKLIIKEFGIDPTMNFSMEVCSNRREVSFIEEEDFSVNAIELAMRGPTIKIVEAKGRHPHLAALEQFKEDISCNERIYTLLVDMLSDPASEQEIWEVLELLPKNRNIFDRLQNISVEYDSQKWKVFFEEPSLKKLSYKLKMLSELIANPMWVAAFKATGGFDELSHRLLSFQKKDFSSIDLTKCVCITLSTFFDCLNSSGTKAEDVLLHLKSDQIFKRLMEYLWMPAPPSIMLTNQILRLLLKLMHLKPELSSIFYANSAQIEALVEQGCFQREEHENELFIMNFTQLFVEYTPSDERVKIVQSMISRSLNLEYLQAHPKCEQYFMLLIGCLEKLTDDQFGSLSTESLTALKEFPTRVFKVGLKETCEKDFNCILYGAFRCKSFLLKKFPAITPEQKQEDADLVNLLVRQYLFHESQTSASHIQSHKNTVELYRLLELLFKELPNSTEALERMLVPKLQKAPWRKLSALDWMLEVERQERKAFCGLKNLRATCYINCLLQQFYMIEPFRDAIMKLDCTAYNPVLKDNEMYQLQKILSFLRYSNKGSYNPREFCQAFRDFQGKPIDVNVQSDADEFFNAFLEKLENLLKVTKTPEIIDDVFRGTLSNQLVCEGCPHSSEREEQFMSLGVNIKNKSSLDEALKGFIEGQILDGDNAYYCQTCRKKVRTLKRLCIKHLPNILIVVLKRFEFNYDSMKKIKVNDYCSFPTELDMRKFTAEHLAAKPQYMPDNYYQFKLRGVVVHYGSSEAGHYYSYIKDPKQQWWEFNDEAINSFNPQDLAEETFGGSESFGSSEYGEPMKSEKCRNAYLLFYEREATYDHLKRPIKTMLDLNRMEGSDRPIKELALQDNSSFEFINIVFDPAFMNFLLHVLQQEAPSLSVCKMVMLYLHTVLLRARDKDDFVVPFCQRIEELLRDNKALSEWYVSQLTKPFVREFLIESNKEVRYITAGLARIAITQVDTVPDDIILSLLNFILNPNDRKHVTPIARIFVQISQRPRQKKFLEALLYPQRVLAILTNDTTKFEDLPQPANQVSQFGTVVEEKEKDRYFRSSPCLLGLIESLVNFEETVTIEDLELVQSQTFDKAAKRMLAKLAAKKLKKFNEEQTQKAINRWGSKMLNGDDRDIRNYLAWMGEVAEISDAMQAQRIEQIVQKQLDLMEACQSTYYPFDNLFCFMIKVIRQLAQMCQKNPVYKAEILRKLEVDINGGGRYLRLIDLWIYKSGSASKLVYNQDWKAYKNKISGSLPESSSYYEDKRDVRQRQFDAIAKKQKDPSKQDKPKDKEKEQGEKDPTLANVEPTVNLGSDDELIDRDLTLPFDPTNQPLYRFAFSSRKPQKVRIVGRAGMLYRICVDGSLRWYAGDRQDQYDIGGSI